VDSDFIEVLTLQRVRHVVNMRHIVQMYPTPSGAWEVLLTAGSHLALRDAEAQKLKLHLEGHPDQVDQGGGLRR
jgi:hypothetical protein